MPARRSRLQKILAGEGSRSLGRIEVIAGVVVAGSFLAAAFFVAGDSSFQLLPLIVLLAGSFASVFVLAGIAEMRSDWKLLVYGVVTCGAGVTLGFIFLAIAGMPSAPLFAALLPIVFFAYGLAIYAEVRGAKSGKVPRARKI